MHAWRGNTAEAVWILSSVQSSTSSTLCIIIFPHKTLIHTYTQNQSLPVLAVVPPLSHCYLYLEPSSWPWRPHFLFLCAVADIHITRRPLRPEMSENIHTLTFMHGQQREASTLQLGTEAELDLFLITGSLSAQWHAATESLFSMPSAPEPFVIYWLFHVCYLTAWISCMGVILCLYLFLWVI